MNYKVLMLAVGLAAGMLLSWLMALTPVVNAEMRGGYWTHDCTVQGVEVLTTAMNGTLEAREATVFYNPLSRAVCVIYHVGARGRDYKEFQVRPEEKK